MLAMRSGVLGEGDPRQDPLVIDGPAERMHIYYIYRAVEYGGERVALVITTMPLSHGQVVSFASGADVPAVAVWAEHQERMG